MASMPLQSSPKKQPFYCTHTNTLFITYVLSVFSVRDFYAFSSIFSHLVIFFWSLQISVRKGRQSPDKVEFLAFDPEIQREVIYKEHHKIKSIREDFPGWYTEPSELKLPQDFKDDNDKKPKSQ